MAQDTGGKSDGVIRLSPLDRLLKRIVKPAMAKKFEAGGIFRLRDLLLHYPKRLIDPAELADLTTLVEGKHVVLAVDIGGFEARPMRNRRGYLVTVELTDGNHTLPTVYFAPHKNRVTYLQRRLPVGRRVVVDGKVGRRNGELQIVHPTIDVVESGLSEEELALERTQPQVRYPVVQGISSDAIGTLIRSQLDQLRDVDLPDPVPIEIRAQMGQMLHATALRALHHPQVPREFHQALRALRFEEAFVLQAAMARRRAQAESETATARPPRTGGLLEAFDGELPFTLTAGQVALGEEISDELSRSIPMHRLLQGEVGSGKTLVALRAMLQVVDAGGQAALLAPTEVLAMQHERTIRALLGPLAWGGMLGSDATATRVVLLTGSMSTAQRRAALAEVAGGAAGIVIGTHALLSEQVAFADLGLVVVDEQHRFGVEQRDALRAKATSAPHLLVMTATPIPRTVAMTIFGDLEVSTLREIPAGRGDVVTHLVDADNARWMTRMWQRLAEEVAAGRRAFVVCPRISPTAEEPDNVIYLPGVDPEEKPKARSQDEPPELESVTEVSERLRELPMFDGVGIGMLHGRMTPEQKEEAMTAFISGAAPVLVSTTVIEVGVDVPEASAMVILDADRFGLSQLHQLRGRIGRGGEDGICFAVTHSGQGTPSYTRLEAFAGTRDGFELAEADLEQRREGDVLGAAQHGRRSGLRLLRVLTDQRVIEEARDTARSVVLADPSLSQHEELAEAIERTLEGDREEFLERS